MMKDTKLKLINKENELLLWVKLVQIRQRAWMKARHVLRAHLKGLVALQFDFQFFPDVCDARRAVLIEHQASLAKRPLRHFRLDSRATSCRFRPNRIPRSGKIRHRL